MLLYDTLLIFVYSFEMYLYLGWCDKKFEKLVFGVILGFGLVLFVVVFFGVCNSKWCV